MHKRAITQWNINPVKCASKIHNFTSHLQQLWSLTEIWQIVLEEKVATDGRQANVNPM